MKVLAALGSLVVASSLLAQGSPKLLEHVATIPVDGTIIGSISDMDLLPNGNYAVLDDQANEILVFSPRGVLVRTIGREGEGPGEIKGAAELEVSEDGDLMIVDFGNMRITRWDSAGQLLGSTRLDALLGPSPGWPHQLESNDAGIFLKTSQFRPNQPVRVFRLYEDLRGIADTLTAFLPTEDGPSCLFCAMSVGPTGRVYAPVGDTSAIVSELGRGGEQASAVRLEGVPAVRRSESEARRLRSAMGRLPIPDDVPIPEPQVPPFKPRFGPHGIGFGPNGELWLGPNVEEGAPSRFYRFDQAGEFLSVEDVDHHLTGFKIRDSMLLGVSETEFGEPVVQVYEIR